ncbi:crossover junction endodeoxyribonuclease RuvC [Micromonospora sp. STR1s_5]|nr:crossover junction endodeoxyribonuclease RuvC [Micromonospora sp. STR1s_5]
MRIAGIDPGIKGAIAVIERATGQLVAVMDMPTIQYAMSDGRKRRKVDSETLRDFVHAYRPELICVEQVTPYKQGRTSAFNFGWSAAVATTVAELSGAAVMQVPPNMWKPRMGLNSDKDGSRALATELEGSDINWDRKRDDGRAEAFLLAIYANRVLHGEIQAGE